eukprot:COSAG02_NODE_4295_length_5539_cov_2.488235_8_plen_111_part_00
MPVTNRAQVILCNPLIPKLTMKIEVDRAGAGVLGTSCAGNDAIARVRDDEARARACAAGAARGGNVHFLTYRRYIYRVRKRQGSLRRGCTRAAVRGGCTETGRTGAQTID